MSAVTPLIELRSFDEAQRRRRLELMQFASGDRQLSERLHALIDAHVPDIVSRLYGYFGANEEFHPFLGTNEMLARLEEVQTQYLLSLGRDFESAEYFQHRLQAGLTHVRIGLPLALYHAAYLNLQQQLIGICQRYGGEEAPALIGFVLRICALDMSLAIETYHAGRVLEMQSSIEELRDKERVLQREVTTDALTGVRNRRYVMQALTNATAGAARNNASLCVAMIDIDHFKSINDTYGHPIGDVVLVDVARRMSGAVRDGDIVGRYGGEEFMIVLPGTPLVEGKRIAERIRTRISDSLVSTAAANIRVTVSIGLAERGSDEEADALVERADAALYSAKAAGRNCVVAQ